MQPHQEEEPLEALIVSDEGVSRWRKITAAVVTLFVASAFLLATISTAPQLPQQISRAIYAVCAGLFFAGSIEWLQRLHSPSQLRNAAPGRWILVGYSLISLGWFALQVPLSSEDAVTLSKLVLTLSFLCYSAASITFLAAVISVKDFGWRAFFAITGIRVLFETAVIILLSLSASGFISSRAIFNFSFANCLSSLPNSLALILLAVTVLADYSAKVKYGRLHYLGVSAFAICMLTAAIELLVSYVQIDQALKGLGSH